MAICEQFEAEFELIPAERKQQLNELRDYVASKVASGETPKLIVICTHNSRRSHLGQLWLAVGADYYGLLAMETFSGGTEATAFNIRAVNALQQIGFQIATQDETATNPIYEIVWKEGMEPYHAFSKKYDDAPNPQAEFAAIMVCTSADEGCPIVAGSDFRLSLPYEDPKNFDDTELEAAKYDERARQIGREILFAFSQIATA